MVGLWYVETPREQLFLRIAFGYAVWAIIFAILVEGVDLYHCIGDFYAVTSNLCTTLLLVMILVKLGSFMFYRDMIMDLIHYAEKNFWNVTYNEVGTRILKEYDKLGMAMVYTFTLIVYVATFNYVFAPFFGIVTVFAYVTFWRTLSFKFSRKAMLYSKGDFFYFL
ncbi:odorant receptor 13a [Lasius niger]|uniref:Odorant receptor 13a n=1 Tax=Lasius niger TaxID=67767 RepID=A0A0J7L4S1_LASNI|nr:odorant receptor 13a [Lasius niger]